MKAIKITTGLNEQEEMDIFVGEINCEDTFAYRIDSTSAMVVTAGECGMAHAKARIAWLFAEFHIDDIQ